MLYFFIILGWIVICATNLKNFSYLQIPKTNSWRVSLVYFSFQHLFYKKQFLFYKLFNYKVLLTKLLVYLITLKKKEKEKLFVITRCFIAMDLNLILQMSNLHKVMLQWFSTTREKYFWIIKLRIGLKVVLNGLKHIFHHSKSFLIMWKFYLKINNKFKITRKHLPK